MTGPALEPESYAALLAQAKAAVRDARLRAHLAVNREVISLYWQLGRLILSRQRTEGWGTKVIERLSEAHLAASFPI